MTMEQALLAAVAALTAAVVFLFKLFWKSASDTDKRLAECEDDRRNLWTRVVHLEEKSCLVAGCKERKQIEPLPTT